MPTTSKYGHPWPLGTDLAAGHDQLDALANSIDTKHAGYSEGSYAARPATGKTGQFYRQTDAGGGAPARALSWWDGTAWVYIGLADGSAAEATARTLGTGAQQAAAGNDPRFVPTGAMMDYAGTSAPTGWLLCAGQEVARATYPALDTLIAQTYGAYTDGAGGVGTTHFRLPDLRGRVTVGLDNMGGTDAGRLDAPNALGGTGGAQYHTLTSGEMPTHTHTITVNSNTTGISAAAVAGGAHIHTASSGTAGSHNHTMSSDGNHQHVQTGQIDTNGSTVSTTNTGSNSRYAETGQGGSNTGQAGLHSHTIYANGDHTHSVTVDSGGSHSHTINVTDGGHTHTATAANAGSGTAHNNMPPYMLVNKIIKT